MSDGELSTRSRKRDVLLLVAGLMVSTSGDAAALVALLLELKTSGVGWLSALLAAELVPFVVFASLSGRLVDRVDNRLLLVVSIAGQGALVALLAFVRTPVLVVALVFAVATVSTVVRPAVNAMVPVLAGEERAASTYGWVAAGTGIGWIAGPAAGGLLASTAGIRATLLADAATFAVLAAACRLLRSTRGRDVATAADVPRLGGLTILWRDVLMRWSVLVTAISVACAVVDNVAAPFRFLDQLGTTSTGYGVYLALWGAGALAGSQLPRLVPAATMPVALAVGNAVSGLGILGIGVAPGVAFAFVASAFGGVGNGIANVSISALVARRVRPDERGRAFATVGAAVQAGTGTGTVAAAPLVAAAGAGHAMAGAGGLAALIAAVTAVWTWLVQSREEERARRDSNP